MWHLLLLFPPFTHSGYYEHNLGRVGLQSEEGPVSGDEEAELRKVEERECGARREGTRGVLDYALGNGRWGEVGVYTLREEERRMRAMGDGGTVVTLRRPENFWVVALGRPVQGGSGLFRRCFVGESKVQSNIKS